MDDNRTGGADTMQHQEGTAAPSGALGLQVVKARTPWPHRRLTKQDIIDYGYPKLGLPDEVNHWREGNLPDLKRGELQILAAADAGVPFMYGQLFLRHRRVRGGTIEVVDLGLASLRVVTNAGVQFIVDAFQNLTELENMRYHALGTGTNAEAVGDTALQTELTTEYDNGGNVRATGTLAEGTAANIYRTVATNTVDTAVAITEHGIFSQAATGGGTLLDRSKFNVNNLDIGDQLQSTYDFTVGAGG